MNLFNNIGVGKDPPSDIYVVIEIPKDSNIKYEVDENSGILLVDRKLYTAMTYPFNYGFIPQTKEEDGDPIDALVLSNDQYSPLSVVQIKAYRRFNNGRRRRKRFQNNSSTSQKN